MREVLFRGKDKDGKRHYGRLAYKFVDIDMAEVAVDVIQDENHATWQVDPDTASQYTGVCDKHGNKIFEGDILFDEDWEEPFVVHFEDGGFIVRNYDDTYWLIDVAVMSRVIGNRWDNPELLPEDE